MASCIEAMTIMRSIDFSRATASAIWSSSSRFALTAILGLLLVRIACRVLGPEGIRIVKREVVGIGQFDRLDVVIVVDRVLVLIGLRHVQELVGHDQFGLGNRGQR